MITATEEVTIAAVEVTDLYRVRLDTRRRHTDLSPDEAEKLADELCEAARESRRMVAEDRRAREARMVQHGFDQDTQVTS